jgi:hypothetical protein
MCCCNGATAIMVYSSRELGGYLASPAHAPAGTKRLSNLLHSPNWQSSQIESYLWQGAQNRMSE